MGKKIKSVQFITSEPFPYGMAATNRILSLCKGLKTNNIDVLVVCMNKTEDHNEILNAKPTGEYEGIQYRYIMNSSIASRFKIKRGIDSYLKNMYLLIYGLKVYSGNTVQIYYSKESIAAILTKIASMIRRSIFIKEETEHPNVRTKHMSKLMRYAFIKYHYNIFDGLFVISENLYTYFKTDTNYRKPVFILPMVVDVDRFSKHRDGRKNNEIVFCGVLDNGKEGIDILLHAFSQIKKSYHDYLLRVYGKTSSEYESNNYLKWFSDTAKGYGVENSAKLMGYRTREAITDIMLNAKILVSPRPHSEQAEYGFSTKLGEYLMSASTVVATRVGGVSNHLTDKENAYLCDPYVESMVQALSNAIMDGAATMPVGAEGRKYALKKFNNHVEIKRIIREIVQEYDL
jgi:glycosyltransferase involved in cell wall biosynthesis